jgi:undecaprenyl-diphosphatase
MTQQKQNLQRFVHARLSPEGAFGLHLTVGVLLMLAAAWLFAAIAGEVVSGAAITTLDVALAGWLHRHASQGFTKLMLAITWMHSVPGILVLALLFGARLVVQRAFYWLLALALAVPGGMLLNVAFKHVFQRARPHFDDPLLTLSTYSFPSGHTASATVLYGLLACYLAAHAPSRRTGALAAAGALGAVALVALSRMYLGVHYLSDVLAAAAEGCAWLAICVTAVSSLRRHRARGEPR